MLNREEYNLAFKTNLSQEEFDEIMGKPITDLSEIEELSIADRKGNVWRFLPKANAIPKEWIKNYAKRKASKGFTEIDCYWQYWEDDVLKMVADWEKENEEKTNA